MVPLQVVLPGLPDRLLVEEITDPCSDFRSVFFEGKVPRIEKVKLQILQVTLVRKRTSGRKDRVVLTQTINVGGWCSRR